MTFGSFLSNVSACSMANLTVLANVTLADVHSVSSRGTQSSILAVLEERETFMHFTKGLIDSLFRAAHGYISVLYTCVLICQNSQLSTLLIVFFCRDESCSGAEELNSLKHRV